MRTPQRVAEIVGAMRKAGLKDEATYILDLVAGLQTVENESFLSTNMIRDERRTAEVTEYTRKQVIRRLLSGGLLDPKVLMTEHKRNRPEFGGEGLLFRARLMVVDPITIQTLTLREPPVEIERLEPRTARDGRFDGI